MQRFQNHRPGKPKKTFKLSRAVRQEALRVRVGGQTDHYDEGIIAQLIERRVQTT
jgi:hypothetical protein